MEIPSLSMNYFICSRYESDEHIWTYRDEYMNWFIRQFIQGGKCTAFSQYYESKKAGIFETSSEELTVRGTFC